ncbi:sigma-70 family RNA polymerase sigma factor [Pseudoflavitalea sp. G-6-1-2]|uniref:RNA polymerase sigma factor n=1 Tax=Pseudoflavitalea sp. G-6-1-2 TaxID=2728841 RepID=UPI00146EB968|nr:sigma-70 family RNA polymerase sigma factor [Pseudoflavitalea sp. G-6-1-2]NML23998.1 sigma-70 family RNA polymerase sigma factor [Pseudoflavitalea sp. G-6-1-2]
MIAEKEYRLRKVIDQTHDQLLSVLLSFTSNRHLCEDILQEAYVRFWNNMEQVKDDDTAIYLLKRYTRNLFLDEMRRISRRESLLANLHTNIAVASAEELAIEKERRTIIQSAIEKLPAQQKKIFRMHKEQALSYRQIADQLGITTGTIETQMNRALKFLRKELAGMNVNDPALTFALIYYALTAH